VGDMDDFPRRMQVLAVRVLGYLLLASAVAVGIAFVVQQGMHNEHVRAVQTAQAEPGLSPWASDSEFVNAYPEPSMALYLTGVALCLASGFLILEPGLRRAVKRVLQTSDSQPA
jgi:hypothetical protein